MGPKLVCQECDYSEVIPNHCGEPMHIEKIEDKEKLVCWMGPSCGVQDLPTHHDKTLKII
jgi:hypothetical protein